MRRQTNRGPGIILLVIIFGAIFFGAVIGGTVGYLLASSGASTPAPAVAAPQSSNSNSPAGLTAAAIGALQRSSDPSAIVDTVEGAVPAVVTVVAQNNMGPSGGSGFFISADGYQVGAG